MSRVAATAATACGLVAASQAFTAAAPGTQAVRSEGSLRGTQRPQAAQSGSSAEPLALGAVTALALGAAGSRRRARTNVACKAAVGEEVNWNGKPAVVKYVGAVKFAPGEWCGLELKTDGGMHNGTVMGVSYYECPAGKGVFATSASLGGAPAPAPAAAPAAAPAVAPAAAPAASPAAPAGAVAVGSTVSWNGKAGTVKYVGAVKFAAGEWVGIELDGEGGMHNGTVMGATYFECPAGKGVFAQASQLAGAAAPAPAAAPAAPAPAAPAPAAAPATPAAATAGAVAVGAKVEWNGQPGTVKFVGATKFAAGEWVGVELDAEQGMHDGTVMGISYFDCDMRHGIFSPASALKVLAAA